MSRGERVKARLAAGLAATALAAGLAPAVAAAVDATSLSWDEAFAVDGAARDVHLQVRYRGADGAWHDLELWRHGDAFAHRRTDDRVDVYVARDEAAAGHFRYHVMDARRLALIEVDRANLFRIGLFSDWSSIAHLLRAPATAVRVTRVARDAREAPVDDANAATPAELACEWYRIAPAGAGGAPAQDVCWSRRWGAPMRVEVVGAPEESRSALQVTRAEAGASDDPGLRPPSLPAGWQFVDANADIDPATD